MDMTNYTAGFARLDITPPLGVPVAGYFEPRFAKGVLDPLFVDAVAFGDGEKSAVLLVVDLVSVSGEAGYTWPVLIAEKLGLEKDSVILCATHTHTGPSVNRDEMYDKWLFRRLCDAATIALNDRKSVTDVRWSEDRAEGLAYVRRYKLSDGTVMTNPAGEYRDMIVGPACHIDDTLRVVRILREEGPEILLGNFQAHPDNIGGEYISADYPGAFRNRIEQLRENTRCVFLDGCEGQMVIFPRIPGVPKTPASHEKATTHGKKLADVALSLVDKTVSTGMAGLSFGQQAVSLKTKRDPSRVPECERIIKLYGEGRWEEYTSTKKQANYMVSEARRIVALEKTQEDYRDTFVSAITFCGLALVGLPVEPFNEVGVQIRANSKFAVTCCLCNANGSHGYLPTAEAHDQGGYEAYNTPYIKGTAELLADTADKLLETL